MPVWLLFESSMRDFRCGKEKGKGKWIGKEEVEEEWPADPIAHTRSSGLVLLRS